MDFQALILQGEWKKFVTLSLFYENLGHRGRSVWGVDFSHVNSLEMLHMRRGLTCTKVGVPISVRVLKPLTRPIQTRGTL
jgi:hypothetical protein